MQIKTTFLIVATLLSGGVYAQSTPTVSPSMNNSSAPAVGPAAALAPNQIVYTPRLPAAAELTQAAAAQGLTVERIEQTSTQMVAVYKNANGQTTTVAYQTLPPAGAGVATPTSPPPSVMYETSPRVLYDAPPRVVYYDYDPVFYPRVWYPPVSVRLGFGFGGFRGGFHHWR